jgi:hypothetical protein
MNLLLPNTICLVLLAKLDHILSSLKPYGDKCGLGFDQNASILKTTPINKGKINFVPSTCVDDIAPRVV